MLQTVVQKVVLPILNQRAKKHKAVLLSAIKDGIDIERAKDLLSYYFKTLNYGLDPGVFEKIDATDYIEIYDRFGVQIFRTYNIFKYTSYSFEELFSKRVDELYERNELLGRMIYRAGYRILDKKSTFETNFCPEHVVVEKKKNGTAVRIGYKFMVPVYCLDSGDIIGVLVCETIKPSVYAEPESSSPQSVVTSPDKENSTI